MREALPLRLRAVEALRRVGGPGALEVLRAAVHDPNAAVREDAAKALQGLGERSDRDTERRSKAEGGNGTGGIHKARPTHKAKEV